MVYHDLPMEEAQKMFDELMIAPEEKATEAIEPPKKSKRKVVKGLVPKNK